MGFSGDIQCISFEACNTAFRAAISIEFWYQGFFSLPLRFHQRLLGLILLEGVVAECCTILRFFVLAQLSSHRLASPRSISC